MWRQMILLPARASSNLSLSLCACFFSMTNIKSAQPICPCVRRILAPASVPADFTAYRENPSYMRSAVRLRHRFRLQTKSIFWIGAMPCPNGIPREWLNRWPQDKQCFNGLAGENEQGERSEDRSKGHKH